MADGSGEVKLVGVDEAYRDIERWASQLGPAVTAAGQSLGETVAEKTRDRVPVLTGTLAASVTVTDIEGAEEQGVGVSIGDDVPYAGWIEFGGSRGRALVPEGRYLYPTALESQPDFARLAEEVADDTARRFSWSTPTT